MSEQTPAARRPANRDRLRAGIQKLNFSNERRVVGPAEIVGLAGAVFILVLVVVSYLYFLLPANTRLDELLSERSLLQSELRDLKGVVSQGESTEASVEKITQSLDQFESDHLSSVDRGRMGLYDSLNTLIRKNGLRNTAGPTYLPLEPSNSKGGTTGSRSANTKWQSVYPGIAISVTVEGPYQSLRKFIRDIEASGQFVIINSVELERSTETNNSLPIAGEGGDPAAGTKNSLVSLHLEMTTYFQRASSATDQSQATAH
jgi:Tfp pilus assembly protein PilO